MGKKMKRLALLVGLVILVTACSGNPPTVSKSNITQPTATPTTVLANTTAPKASSTATSAASDLVTAHSSHLVCIAEVKPEGTPYVVDRATGSDLFPGTAKCPLHTIQRAAELMNDNDESIIREGRYPEFVTISGKNNLAFMAADGERVVLDGSADIEHDLGGEWMPYKDGIYRAKIAVDVWQLFVDWEEMVPARWPNANFLDGSIFDKTHHWAHGTIDDGPSYDNGMLIDAGAVVNGHEGLLTSGIDPIGAIAVLNVGSFKTWSRKITGYDSTTGTIEYDEVPNWKTKHHDYFLEGKLELLDVPGEWFFDKEAMDIYFMPPTGKDPTDMNIRGKTRSYGFASTDGNDVRLVGIEFFATTFKFENCNGCTVENCSLLYPSTSKRSLGIAGEDPGGRWTSRFDKCYGCKVRDSSFLYTDGSALEMSGGQNTVENSYSYHIDWSGADLDRLMTTIQLTGEGNVFTYNTLHKLGASSTVNPGNEATVTFNDISDTGLVQSDGAMVQLMMDQQLGATIAYNWLHDSSKYGIRMDSPVGGTAIGHSSSVHHNVMWNIRGAIMVKGDKHEIYNNTVFASDYDRNDIIVMAAGNNGTITRNNAANRISGHRTGKVSDFPVPGEYQDNFNGYVDVGYSVEAQLVDPADFDFRSKLGSALALLGAGAYGSSDDDGIRWVAGTTVRR
jgi:hypothetical protein